MFPLRFLNLEFVVMLRQKYGNTPLISVHRETNLREVIYKIIELNGNLLYTPWNHPEFDLNGVSIYVKKIL